MKKALIILLLVLAWKPALALDRFDIVTTEELYSLLAQRDGGKVDFILVNTLDRMIAEHHSIPGSVNIPWSSIEQNHALLGNDRQRLIITYCMGYR